MILVLPKNIIEEIITRSRESKIEICGFIFGTKNGERFIGKEVEFIRNRLNSSVEFEMDPEEMINALERAERKGLEVVTIFHSHLNCPPYPSKKDIKGMENWRIPWLIVSLKGDMKAFILRSNNEVEEVKIITHPTQTLP
ncbi:M67 family metallopeptidase [Pyrococcus horikoshii]|nr:M67 family metallopeptidase [Pyrococcus horikoshii]HII60475.1 M67 family metallopeptidase [Pyrococcus horikoshii]